MSRRTTRVAVLTTLYEPSLGGLQETLRLSAEFLVRRGMEVCVYTSQARNDDELAGRHWKVVRNFLPEQTKNGVKIRRFDLGGPYDFLLSFFRAFWMHGIKKGVLLKEMARFKPDVILAAPAASCMLSIALEAVERSPGARLFVYAALQLGGLDDKEQEALLGQLRRADLVLVGTEYEKEFLISRGSEPGKVGIMGPGVDPQGFFQTSDTPPDKRLMNRVLGKKYVLYLGRKQSGRGIEALLEAVEQVRRERPELHVVLAGEETGETGSLLGPAGGKPFVIQTGPVDAATKRWLMENALAFSRVSSVGGYGLAFCESWMARRPVIATDNGQMRCVVQDGEDGWLVPYQDGAALAAKILFFLENPAEADRMGMRGYQKVMERATGHALERQLYDLILKATHAQ